MIEFDSFAAGKEARIYKNSGGYVLLALFGMIISFPLGIGLDLLIESLDGLKVCLFILWVSITLIYIPLLVCAKIDMESRRLYIENDILVWIDRKNKTRVHIKYVTKVVEKNSCYLITVCCKDEIIELICEKVLLIKGTLEEFEALFEGKIERRQSK